MQKSDTGRKDSGNSVGYQAGNSHGQADLSLAGDPLMHVNGPREEWDLGLHPVTPIFLRAAGGVGRLS